MTWNDHFLHLFDRCVKRYRNGDKTYTSYYDDEDIELLRAIGYRSREFFDFVEDWCDEGAPSPTDALLVAAVRRDYFNVVLKGEIAQPTITRDNIPTFGDTLDGIPYLPRILAKARGKLLGELDPDLMYGCGGDRKFLRENGDIHPADFLRHVWAAGDDDAAVAKWIKSR
ncbi:hypothetical protein HAHE_31390 [Haloferula helveola]|uniref:DUF5069 domain-containing protein n=1 Tax=Haloferula helveola TaxID=490095 RepID=A0ABM7RC26_9BACT|nr:hypothetical protein HAHE_31390 [Haloferula helveola]